MPFLSIHIMENETAPSAPLRSFRRNERDWEMGGSEQGQNQQAYEIVHMCYDIVFTVFTLLNRSNLGGGSTVFIRPCPLAFSD